MAENRAREELIARGHHAQAILDDPMVNEAFDTLENEIMRVWRMTEAGDIHSRERAWLALQLSERLKQVFIGIVSAGQIARSEVQKLLQPVDARPAQPS